MTQEKVEQNTVILELRDIHGLSWGQILEELQKRGLTGLSSPASVKMKYYAVKNRKKAAPGPRHRLRQPLTSPSTSTSTNPHRDKRMTFWLPEETIEKIKARAGGQRQTASAFLRDLLKKHL